MLFVTLQVPMPSVYKSVLYLQCHVTFLKNSIRAEFLADKSLDELLKLTLCPSSPFTLPFRCFGTV